MPLYIDVRKSGLAFAWRTCGSPFIEGLVKGVRLRCGYMDERRLAHWRMRSVRLTGPPVGTVDAVLRWLGAVQSQDYGPAKWSIAQRMAGIDDAALDRAFADGALLRTHVLRPTWHFVRPRDIRWMLGLTAPRVHALNAYYYRQLGLDSATRKKTNRLIAGLLRGGNHLTRKEIGAALESHPLRLGYIMINAELDGVVCSGPLRGKQHTYALLDERAPGAVSLSRDEALAELTVRYFSSHGPATVADFRWWSSLPATEARLGLEAADSRLRSEVVDGTRYWFAEPAPRSAPRPPAVHLLQAYDEFVVGYPGMAGEHARQRSSFNGVVLLDARLAGAWRRKPTRDGVVVETVLYGPFDDEQLGSLAAAAERYGNFLGRPATVVTRANPPARHPS
jgi:hypothetical protein